MMKKIKITELLIFVIAAELVGAFSGILAGGSFYLYGELPKPPFSPPNWLFPIAWGILYALMGISAYLIFNSNAEPAEKKKAMIIYIIQLFLNFSWSIVFFRFEMIGLSVAVILLLLIFVIAMIVTFYKIRPISAYLNIPYLIWLIYASYLNIGILINSIK